MTETSRCSLCPIGRWRNRPEGAAARACGLLAGPAVAAAAVLVAVLTGPGPPRAVWLPYAPHVITTPAPATLDVTCTGPGVMIHTQLSAPAVAASRLDCGGGTTAAGSVRLKREVCAGTITLAAGQADIKDPANWH